MRSMRLMAGISALCCLGMTTDRAMAGTDRGHAKHADDGGSYRNSMTSISDGLGATGSGSTPLDKHNVMMRSSNDLAGADDSGGHARSTTVISADTDLTIAGAAGHIAPS